ncbi:MAG: Lrp/AsnC family transcriptional regulator, partial [Gemmatimonadaceae bacterium]|nr:Lrp/AsnC family transcriptional regulator [Gemmatimonadaceae bacterium]
MTDVSDTLDRSILTLLANDGRLANLEMARRLGVSEKTIRLRITRLVRDHGMRVVATLGNGERPTRMLFLVHTVPGRRFEVAERLVCMDAVQRVFATTGAFDLVVEAAFSTDAHALEFLVREVEAVDGVTSCQSVHLIKEVVRGGPAATGLSRAEDANRLDFGRFISLAARATSEDELLRLGAEAALWLCGADRSLVSMFDGSDTPVATGNVAT